MRGHGECAAFHSAEEALCVCGAGGLGKRSPDGEGLSCLSCRRVVVLVGQDTDP